MLSDSPLLFPPFAGPPNTMEAGVCTVHGDEPAPSWP